MRHCLRRHPLGAKRSRFSFCRCLVSLKSGEGSPDGYVAEAARTGVEFGLLAFGTLCGSSKDQPDSANAAAEAGSGNHTGILRAAPRQKWNSASWAGPSCVASSHRINACRMWQGWPVNTCFSILLARSSTLRGFIFPCAAI